MAEVSKSNGLAVAATVLGIGAFFFALIPVVGFASIPFALVGLCLGIAGFARATKGYEGTGLSITGSVACILALGMSALYAFVIGGAANEVAEKAHETAENIEESQNAAQGSRQAPLAFGQAHDIGDGWTVKVDGFNPDANAAVAEANMFNEPPAPGHRYVVVTPSATYTGDAETASTYDLTFSMVGASGQTIETFNQDCVPPEPTWNMLGDVYQDGTLTGNLCFEVAEADIDSLVLIAEPTLALSGNKAYLAVR